jgi:hypothetical protein
MSLVIALAAAGALVAATSTTGAKQTTMAPMRRSIANTMRVFQGPLGRAMLCAYLLPNMQSELKLSKTQTEQLQELKNQFVQDQQKLSSQIAAKRKALNQLVDSGLAKEAQVKSQLTTIADLEAQQQLDGFKSGMMMRALLSQSQRSRLDAMTPMQMGQYMMSHVTLGEMVQMARLMHGAITGPMMGGGMMTAGTMHRGMMGGGMMSSRKQPASSSSSSSGSVGK